jgi:hypothetical protein
MFRPRSNGSRRGVRMGAVAATAVAFAVSTGLVWQASYAAFSAQTINPNNTWAVGSVTLSDDDAGAAMFSATNLKPGATGAHCIVVTSNGTLPAAVKLYGTGLSTTNGLSSYINLTVTQGTGGSFGSCTGYTQAATNPSVYSGTLAGFTANSYATGLGIWTPTGAASEARTFQFTYTVSATPPDTTQGGTASVNFVWESQNT